LLPKWPKLAVFIDDSETDVPSVLSYLAFIEHSPNPPERLTCGDGEGGASDRDDPCGPMAGQRKWAAQSICGLSRPTEKIPRPPKLSWTQALETHRHVSTNGFRMARLERRPC
jgi:hypothetical protein